MPKALQFGAMSRSQRSQNTPNKIQNNFVEFDDLLLKLNKNLTSTTDRRSLQTPFFFLDFWTSAGLQKKTIFFFFLHQNFWFFLHQFFYTNFFFFLHQFFSTPKFFLFLHQNFCLFYTKNFPFLYTNFYFYVQKFFLFYTNFLHQILKFRKIFVGKNWCKKKQKNGVKKLVKKNCCKKIGVKKLV